MIGEPSEQAWERLLGAIVQDAANALDAPHVVLAHNTSTDLTFVSGPYPSGLEALAAADREARREADDHGDLVFRVAQVHPPAGS
jgi:hypothetical protein